jgi:hypothetical protein
MSKNCFKNGLKLLMPLKNLSTKFLNLLKKYYVGKTVHYTEKNR